MREMLVRAFRPEGWGMSIYLEKQKLLDWLQNQAGTTENRAYIRVTEEIASGRFDWAGESE